MPIYTIEDSQTGRRLKIEGDTEPTEADIEELFSSQAEPVRDAYNSQLRAAPEQGVLSSLAGGARDLLSPLIGPSKRQIAEESVMIDGQPAYRPGGSRAEKEGLIPSLFTQHETSPLFIDRTPINPEDSTVKQVATGARNVGANLVNALSSPGSLLTLGAGGLMSPGATKALGGAFAADVARHVPELATEAGRTSVEGTPGEIVESTGNLGLSALGVIGGGIHAAQSTPRGNLIRAIRDAELVNPVPPDVAAVNALDPSRGEWQPLSPARKPMAELKAAKREADLVDQIVTADAAEAVSPEGFSPVDRLVAENRFTPRERPIGEIVAEPRAVREVQEGGKLPQREYPESKLTKGDYEPPVDVPPQLESQGPRQPLRTQEEILAARLKQRDALDSIARMGDVNAKVDANVINDALGIGADPVPLEVAQKTIFDQTWEAELQKALGRSGPKPGYWERVQKWADHTIKESKGNVGSGVDPTVAAAYAVKAADLVAKGASRSFEAFKTEFEKRFPEATEMARDVWNRLTVAETDIFKALDESKGIDGFNQAARSLGGTTTSLAYRVGELTDTPQKLARLEEGMARFRQEARDAIARHDFDEASALAMKGQFYREAMEYATGTGSAGTYLRSKDPNFVPPMERVGDRVVSFLDRGIKALEGDQAKVMEGVTGLPVWLTREAARGVLQAVKAAYLGSKSLSKAIDQGVKWLKENGTKAEDAQIRDWLDSQLRWERLGTEADAGPTRVRKSVQNAASSPEFTKEVKQAMAQDPESRYQQQMVAPRPGKVTVTDIVADMDDAQLAELTPRSNIYVAGKMEAAKRLMRRGENEAAYRVFKDLAAEGTSFGQNINQFNQLKGADPTHVTRVLNRQLIDNGYDPLTEPQVEVITNKSKKAIEANDRLDEAKRKWTQEPTEENAKAAEKAQEDAQAPAMDLQREILRLQPKNLPTVLKAVIQGNLLTPISEVSNIVGNVSLMPFRAAADTVAASIDMLDSYLRNKPRELVMDPVGSQREGLKGVVEGLKQAPSIARRGASDVRSGEQFRGLQPLRAWSKLLAKNPEVPTVRGKVPLSDKISLLVEGTFGVPAETMLRGLSVGDAPFRRKAHAQALEQQLELTKVPKSQREFARKFPEMFLTPEQLQRVHEETLASIFQQHSDTVSTLNRFIRQKGGDWGDLAATLVLPYRHTPWNLIGEYLSYNPVAGLLNTTAKAIKGDKLGAERAAAKTVVGGITTYAMWWLYQKGLLSPSLDDSDEQQKARILSGSVMPANHINLDGLDRALKGEDPAFRPGDKTVDTWKLGLAGAIAYTTANLGRDFEKSPEGESGNVGNWLKNSVLENMRFGLNQSFLKGTSTMLEAIRTGRADQAIQGIESVILSVPVPNTVSAVSRATSGNKVEVKDDNKLKEFSNLVEQRLRVFGTGKDLPVKRGIWGEPMKETPEGANPWAYHFLDITRGQQVTQDPVAVEIYRLWRRYNNAAVIPTPPSKSMEIDGQRYELTTAQQGELASQVGPIRKQIADSLVQNPNWQELNDEQKSRMLQRAYETGLRIGKQEFLAKNRAALEAKGKAAGFKPR